MKLITHLGQKVPARIGHDFEPILSHAVEMVKEEPFKSHRRLKVFANKGTICAYCNSKIGIYLIKALDRFGNVHYDVYTKDFVLMTIDHLIPKSKGGTDDLYNLVPCCSSCNTRKNNESVVPGIVLIKDNIKVQIGDRFNILKFLCEPFIQISDYRIAINPLYPEDTIPANEWIQNFKDICALEQYERFGSLWPSTNNIKIFQEV